VLYILVSFSRLEPSRFGKADDDVLLRCERLVNLLLALRRDSDTGNKYVAAGARDLDRISQIGADAVKRGQNVQFIADCGVRGRADGCYLNMIVRPTSFSDQYGRLNFSRQFRDLHPFPIAKLESSFHWLQILDSDLDG